MFIDLSANVNHGTKAYLNESSRILKAAIHGKETHEDLFMDGHDVHVALNMTVSHATH